MITRLVRLLLLELWSNT